MLRLQTHHSRSFRPTVKRKVSGGLTANNGLVHEFRPMLDRSGQLNFSPFAFWTSSRGEFGFLSFFPRASMSRSRTHGGLFELTGHGALQGLQPCNLRCFWSSRYSRAPSCAGCWARMSEDSLKNNWLTPWLCVFKQANRKELTRADAQQEILARV